MLTHRKKKNVINLLDNFEMNIETILPHYNVFLNMENHEKEIKCKASEIILKLSDIEQVSFEHSVIGTCLLLQAGAYLKSVTNKKINIKGIEFSKKNLVFASDQVNNVYTFRSISQALRFIIAKISLRYNIPGHLYYQFKLENVNFITEKSKQEITQIAAYCTEFQIDNPDTPYIVREFLAIREKNRKFFKF